ncbi:MAG: hypothetical protein K2K96_05290 [Lachnospiraceae bacterium]|nr:hypothetical protein [Lachnospiraceae bacterium]
MYTCYHEFIWKAEKQHLELEISKAEGQLRNCRFRTGLLMREMIVCGGLLVVPLVMIFVDALFPVYSSGSIVGNMMAAGRETFDLVLQGFYICLFPFLVFFFVKAIIIWLINKYNRSEKKPLEEYDPYRKEFPKSEVSYAIEEEKLVRILSIYYTYRKKMEQIKDDLTEDEASMTPEELRTELDKLVYYEEVVPAEPFQREVRVRTMMITAIVSVIVIICIIYW